MLPKLLWMADGESADIICTVCTFTKLNLYYTFFLVGTKNWKELFLLLSVSDSSSVGEHEGKDPYREDFTRNRDLSPQTPLTNPVMKPNQMR